MHANRGRLIFMNIFDKFIQAIIYGDAFLKGISYNINRKCQAFSKLIADSSSALW
jgi:hypothetical protein